MIQLFHLFDSVISAVSGQRVSNSNYYIIKKMIQGFFFTSNWSCLCQVKSFVIYLILDAGFYLSLPVSPFSRNKDDQLLIQAQEQHNS